MADVFATAIYETVKLSQHSRDGIYGDVVTLQADGTFTINKFDGITVLTAEQADRIAAMLMRWAAITGQRCAGTDG